MAFPSETFVGQFSSDLQPVADELRASGAQLTAYLGTQHNTDGSHGALTAESIDVSGDATLSGFVVIDGADIDPITNDIQVRITRDGAAPTVTAVSPSLQISTDVSGWGSPFLLLSDSVNTPASGYTPFIRLNSPADSLVLQFNSTGDANLVVFGGKDFVVSSAIRERGRTVAMGVWIPVTYAAGNFTASAGTWTVDAADQVTYAYTLIGTTMTLTWHIKQTDVSNAASLRIAIPGGYLAARQASSVCRALDAGGAIVASACEVTAGVAYMTLYADLNGNNFTVTAADNTYVFGTFTFEVQ